MTKNTSVSTAIVCLWANAKKQGPIADLEEIANDYGWCLRENWKWEEGSKGFYPPEEMDIIATLFETIPQQFEESRSNDLLLATLWLSRGLVEDNSSETTEMDIQKTLSKSKVVEVDRKSEESRQELDSQDSEDSAIEQVIGQTLETIVQDLQGNMDSLTETRSLAISEGRGFLLSLEEEALAQARQKIAEVDKVVEMWQSKKRALEVKTRDAAFRTARELNGRLDLDPDQVMAEQMHQISEAENNTVSDTGRVLKVIEQIFAYDQQKDQILDELNNIQNKTVDLLDELAVWVNDTNPFEEKLIETETLADATLTTTQEYLANAKNDLESLQKQLIQFRESSYNRVVSMAGRIKDDEENGEDYEVLPDFSVSEIGIESITDLSSKRLSRLEKSLEDIINQKTMAMQNKRSSALAAKLRQQWQSDLLQDLLNTLAEENRDAEIVLILLASAATHSSPKKILLDDEMMDSYLRGLDVFSEDIGIAQLLNLGVSRLLSGWEPSSAISKTKLCLLLIAAKYAGKYELPSDFLWGVATEWPFSHMEKWTQLWQKTLFEKEAPVIVDKDRDSEWLAVKESRQQCQNVFAQDGGSYNRLQKIKSNRHQVMLYRRFLPRFENLWQSIQALETKLERASENYELDRLVTQLENLVADEVNENLTDESLVDSYDHAVYEEEIIDRNPYHRRTTLRVLQEYAESLGNYAHAVLDYWRPHIQTATFSKKSLMEELSSHSDLVPLGKAVVAALIQADHNRKPEWASSEAEQAINAQFVSVLLTQSTYSQRLPSVVGYLVGNQLSWADFLAPLLENLAQPVDAVEAVKTLLERGATNQALLLAQQVPLELQKQIQNQRVEEERQVSQLQEDLIKAGGDIEDLNKERELGRWPLLKSIMKDRLDFYQIEAEEKALQIQEQARELLTVINQTEMEAFEFQSLMPSEAYDLLGQGLSLARSIVRRSESFAEVREYLGEIQYRLEREAWSTKDFRQMMNHLREMTSDKKDKIAGLRSEDVLEHLQEEDLRSLGLSPTDLSSSEITTRIELLRDWIRVRNLPAFLSDNLPRMHRDQIHKLFSNFAQMTSMARYRSPKGNPLIFEDPIVYEYWTLKYPKTSVLKRNCILVSLPGLPPSPQHLKELDHIIQEKDWLTYGFVLLFAPGLTEQQRARLRQSYKDQGVVVIDESALLDMILAGAERTPLGHLRALMLNAYGAQNVDVFKVNQSVEPKTGIFVGRDYLVRRLSSSGDNYALYGGRRIGKSSILRVVGNRLQKRGWIVVADSLEGRDCSDDAVARNLGRQLPFEVSAQNVEDFRTALQQYLNSNAEAKIVFILDEIDPYIRANPDRHLLMETLRPLADDSNRFRVIVAGFMHLYNCLKGKGPYSPSSDPWRRMFNGIRLDNLSAISAERIVKEGFLDVLGWDFENRAVARWIVERTSGHPAFVQYYCLKLKDIVAMRNDRRVRLQDILDVFADEKPDDSFISHVRSTLAMNLDSIEGTIGRYVILWLATESKKMQGFTFAQAQEIASLSGVEIPESCLERALERLKVTSVVEERSSGTFDFSVPDYPLILNRLGDTAHLDKLESKLKEHFGGDA
jgi:hypothetical protein